MDAVDRKILDLLQQDATLPVAELAEQVGISAAPCWRRVKKLEASGVIRRRVALVDRRKVNVPTTVFVAVKAPRRSSSERRPASSDDDVPPSPPPVAAAAAPPPAPAPPAALYDEDELD